MNYMFVSNSFTFISKMWLRLSRNSKILSMNYLHYYMKHKGHLSMTRNTKAISL